MDSIPQIQELMPSLTSTLVPQMRFGAKGESCVRRSVRSGPSILVLHLQDAQHELPSGPATHPDQWPAGAPLLHACRSILRICIMGQAVMTVIWNDDGWFGEIEPGEWIIDVVKWACDQDWSQRRTVSSELEPWH